MKTVRTCRLETPFESENDRWQNIYPRPQMARESFLSLCGEWELSIIKNEAATPIGTIAVPFPPESALSGIERTLEEGEHYLYEKVFKVEEEFINETVLLHFGAVDQVAKVSVNGAQLGRHVGGYHPFTFDVTEHIRIGKNKITVEVYDDLDTDIPYGKQRKKRGGMWYTPISGIWQPVWMESVPKNHIAAIRLTPSLHNILIEVSGGITEKIVTIKTPGGFIEHRFFGSRTLIEIPNPVLWTPENPHLYPFTIASGKDFIKSYFALRTITTETANGKPYIALNGKPYFFHGLLDQGYFSDGIYLPASPKGYENDIKTMKELGFNMLRKHIKIEPETFYYDCDRYGMIVFQDMVNNGKYNFLVDTAIPTLGLKK
jgi:beta-galactosidase/beta-glucuronidase